VTDALGIDTQVARRGVAVRGGAFVGPRGGVAVRRTGVVGPRGAAVRRGALLAPGGVAVRRAAVWYYTDPSRTQGFWDTCP
jgi:hypothetical protein